MLQCEKGCLIWFQEFDVYWLLTPLQMATASLDMDLG